MGIENLKAPRQKFIKPRFDLLVCGYELQTGLPSHKYHLNNGGQPTAAYERKNRRIPGLSDVSGHLELENMRLMGM